MKKKPFNIIPRGQSEEQWGETLLPGGGDFSIGLDMDKSQMFIIWPGATVEFGRVGCWLRSLGTGGVRFNRGVTPLSEKAIARFAPFYVVDRDGAVAAVVFFVNREIDEARVFLILTDKKGKLEAQSNALLRKEIILLAAMNSEKGFRKITEALVAPFKSLRRGEWRNV